MPSGRNLIVGIDLGTTHTVVAWTRRDDPTEPRIFEVPQLVAPGQVAAQPLLPAFLYAPLPGEDAHAHFEDAHAHFEDAHAHFEDAPWIIGEHARRRGQEVPGRLVSSAKSWLCHAAVDRTAAILPWGLDETDEVPRLSPVQASTRILLHVRRTWNQSFPDDPLEKQQVVLTVPASFDQAARELTLTAAHQAGLTVRLLEEPQAAFYDYMQRLGSGQLDGLLTEIGDAATVLVCDVGGGTTDLTLIGLGRDKGGAVDVSRAAVGRHLLLGGDNMDLALAHLCEPRLAEQGRLEPKRFGQLVLACRAAKERLFETDPPGEMPIALAGLGSALVGSTRRTQLSREEVERVVLEGFVAHASRDSQPQRRRTGLVAFGLPYEQDPAITRHIASFFARHAPEVRGPSALLLNGGVFRAKQVVERLVSIIQSWGGPELRVLEQPHPDLAVARGAVAYGLALAGHGIRIGGGTPHGFYLSLDVDRPAPTRQAICVVPKGAKEGERHAARARPLALKVGRPVRFELFASDSQAVHAPGEVVDIDEEQFQKLPPVTVSFEADEGSGADEVRVALEGELSAIGTLELACVQSEPAAGDPRRFRLAFELRGAESPERAAARDGHEPGGPPTLRALGQRLAEAREGIERVFGKGRKDVKPRETKDLVRLLERLLGARASWTTELTRELFDVLSPHFRARRRSADHERVFWMLAGYCLRPGFGDARDRGRIKLLSPLFREGLAYQQEARGWQQFFIAWRRVAGGLHEKVQLQIRDQLDPFLASTDTQRKKPKGFKPQAPDELLELASWLERVPIERRSQLGRWILERTWTDRDPRLWAAIGRIGARVPLYGSVHQVVPPRTAERWLDHLLREKWSEMPSAPAAAFQLARVTNDRARDVSEATRSEVAKRLEQADARPEWIEAVRDFVPVAEAERADRFGEELPVGLRLLE